MASEARPTDAVYPTFLLIGVAKAGTSWIYEVLREHPEVYVPPAKDLKFFDEHYDLGMDWYLDHFAAAGDFKARGELTHDYYFSAETARRIHENLPEVKLLCCLREIGDKMISGYNYNRTTEYDRNITFEEYAALPQIERQNDYYDNLKPFYDLFGAERMCVLYFDDLKRDPAGFCRQIYAFIGVDPDFAPPTLTKVVNAAHEARMQWLAHLAFKLAHYMRKVGLANLVGRVKRNPITNAFLYRSSKEKPHIDPAMLRRVRQRYVAQYDQLAAMTGRPVPQAWYDLAK